VPEMRALLIGSVRVTPDQPPSDWLLFSAGRVERAGSGDPPRELVDMCDVIRLPAGAVAVPVLHDAHVHLLGTGLMDLGVDVSAASGIDEVLALIEEGLRGFDGPLLRAHSFDPGTLTVSRYPTMRELDAVAGQTPVFVRRRDGHSSAVNRAAFDLIGLRSHADGVETDETGGPTGTLRGRAHTTAAATSADLLTRSERVRALHLGAESALRAGAGVVHVLTGRDDPEDREIELALEVADELPIDVVIYPQTTDVDRVAALGLPRIGGCILLDGSFGSRTAALSTPYSDAAGSGCLYFDDDTLTSFVRRAHARGMQVSLHAIGDRGIRQAVRCITEAVGSEGVAARHRIEHCELPDAAALAAIAREGIGLCVQPAFERYWGGPGGMYERRLGEERMRATNPYRTMLDAGIPIGGGSDSYVTPIDPLGGMAAAVDHPTARHRIEPAEALDLFTRGAAWLAFDEHRVGTLLPGSEASFTVLDRDPVVAEGGAGSVAVLGVYLRGVRTAPSLESRNSS